MGSQQYIGTPNGVVMCINSIQKDRVCGSLYHFYQRESIPFTDLGQALSIMEKLFDSLHFPRPANSDRMFSNRQTDPNRGGNTQMEKTVTDQELSGHRGDLGTFIIRVQHRENSSWQGRVTWLEEDRTLNFRSIWELVKLVENAIDTVDDSHEKEPSWYDEK